MLLNVQTEQAKRAYETGGRDALAAVLAKFQQITQFEVVFTDAKGTDLLTGKVRPELVTLPKPRSRWRLPYPLGGRQPIIARQDSTHQYRLFLIDQRRNLDVFLPPAAASLDYRAGDVAVLCVRLPSDVAGATATRGGGLFRTRRFLSPRSRESQG